MERKCDRHISMRVSCGNPIQLIGIIIMSYLNLLHCIYYEFTIKCQLNVRGDIREN